MATKNIPGLPIALIAIGGVLVWSGIENEPVTAIFRTLATGKAPAKGPAETFAVAAQASSSGSAGSGTGSAPPGDTGSSTARARVNQATGRILAAPMGWSTGQQWEDLVSLWNKESGWDNLAQNPTSTAYGIAQFLDTTWAPYGPKTSNALLQIKYGLEYIKDRYGNPSEAWAHEVANNWY